MRDENLPVLFLNLRRRKVKWKLFLRCKNDVCVGALSVKVTMLYFIWFVSHFTVDVTRLLLSLAIHCWLLIYQQF